MDAILLSRLALECIEVSRYLLLNRAGRAVRATTDAMSTRFEYTRSHSGPPVGRAFVGFVAATVVGLGLVRVEAGGAFAAPTSAAVQLGTVAATLFGVSGLLCCYRAIVGGDRMAGVIAAVLLAPGALWSWSAFAEAGPVDGTTTGALGSAAAALAIVLLVRGLRSARWLEVFSGLGALLLALATVIVRADGTITETATLALVVALAGMTSLYGLLVDIEVSEFRSLRRLHQVERRLATESRQTEELLHDLRSGLLSIEAASGGSGGGDANPVRCEAARLRQLTVGATTADDECDLVPGLKSLVATKRLAGLRIELCIPTEVPVHGDEMELLAVVENLLANAQRHGRDPIVVEVARHGGSTRLAVTDAGDGIPPIDADSVFHRGVSSHPGGSGLGLSRARRLARRNNATVELESAGPTGTTFVLSMESAVRVGAA